MTITHDPSHDTRPGSPDGWVWSPAAWTCEEPGMSQQPEVQILSAVRTGIGALHDLHRTGGRYALTTMCIGVGQGIAAIFERIPA